MMNQQQNIDMVIRDFGKALNANVNMAHTGSTIITTSQGHKVWIETHPDSPMLLIHIKFGDMNAHHLSLVEIRKMLVLNSHQHILRGAWVAISKNSPDPRLCTAIPVEIITTKILKTLFFNLLDLSKEVMSVYDKLAA